MSAADCLRLRHRGRGRRRYSLRFEEPIDWSALADTLRVRLTGTPFRFRLNPIAQSVVISGITASNDQAWQAATVALVAALEEIGAAAPAPEVSPSSPNQPCRCCMILTKDQAAKKWA